MKFIVPIFTALFALGFAGSSYAESCSSVTREMIYGRVALQDAKEKQDYLESARQFETAVDKAPSCAAAYFNLGIVYEKVGAYQKALDALKKYLSLSPQASDTDMVQGKIYELEYRAEKNKSTDGRYRDNGEGTITDTRTNLMWTKEDSYVTLGKCLGWDDSKEYVSRLNTGGYNDWRMPTVRELSSIFEEPKKRFVHHIEIHIDPIFASGATALWTSETDGAGNAWTVFFSSSSSNIVGPQYRGNCDDTGVRGVRP